MTVQDAVAGPLQLAGIVREPGRTAAMRESGGAKAGRKRPALAPYFESLSFEIEEAIFLNASFNSSTFEARKACCGLVAHLSRKSSL